MYKRQICGYLISGETPPSAVAERVDDLFADPIIEIGAANTAMLTTPTFADGPETIITVGFKPGVTDNPGKAATDGFLTLFPDDVEAKIATYTTYVFYGLPSDCDASWLAGTLHNGLIERALIADRSACETQSWPELMLSLIHI